MNARKNLTLIQALALIRALYATEAEIRGQRAEWRKAVRQEKNLPLMMSLKALIDEKQKTLSKKSRLSKAFAYIENHWDALCCYCHDGHVEIDNNAAERAIRAVAVGRKNWMFFGSARGGERGAMLYSLLGTCKLNGVDPEAWLRHVLGVLPD
ncbi:transposase [Erwinia tracheiphila]|uniref:Transposase n=1 Tax=Erwinia tracheiphila TaxID=65700 RepID=A0A0M2K5T1_9GAMM|nr:transposase [Erwinia tracheiphila]